MIHYQFAQLLLVFNQRLQLWHWHVHKGFVRRSKACPRSGWNFDGLKSVNLAFVINWFLTRVIWNLLIQFCCFQGFQKSWESLLWIVLEHGYNVSGRGREENSVHDVDDSIWGFQVKLFQDTSIDCFYLEIKFVIANVDSCSILNSKIARWNASGVGTASSCIEFPNNLTSVTDRNVACCGFIKSRGAKSLKEIEELVSIGSDPEHVWHAEIGTIVVRLPCCVKRCALKFGHRTYEQVTVYVKFKCKLS